MTQNTPHAIPQVNAVEASSIGEATVIDVRRLAKFEEAHTMLPNAVWRDPSTVSTWASEFQTGQDVVVYCVFGHEVSQNAAAALQALGIHARFLEGGIDSWEKAGLPLVAK